MMEDGLFRDDAAAVDVEPVRYAVDDRQRSHASRLGLAIVRDVFKRQRRCGTPPRRMVRLRFAPSMAVLSAGSSTWVRRLEGSG